VAQVLFNCRRSVVVVIKDGGIACKDQERKNRSLFAVELGVGLLQGESGGRCVLQRVVLLLVVAGAPNG
jgi:hypothetical protein